MNVDISKVSLLGNRILIKPDPIKKHEIVQTGGLVTATGLKIGKENGIESMQEVEPPTGVVTHVGPECKLVEVGQRVLFSPFSGKALDFKMEVYLLMHEQELVLIIQD